MPHTKLGPGAASEVVTIRTKGTRPQSPVQHRLLSVNATTVSLLLSTFTSSECPVAHFQIKLRRSGQYQWSHGK